ncbi:CGNR zinc finger domain-containing protein [Nonomuraea sediminis]|uniref:CGNR zinc finger domain-containing protein n=1 Tax=Nonomuraea sediminis TaxID=2835864 RepID=UPI001BDD921D|nr:ABATE domain-containing protein [Nonomuraea sediminis]
MEFREGAGRLSLDFIRTLRRRGLAGEVEELPDVRALAAWTHQFSPGPLTPTADASGEGRPAVRDVSGGEPVVRDGGGGEPVVRGNAAGRSVVRGGAGAAGWSSGVRVEEAWELREAVNALVRAARDGRAAGQGERDVVNRAAARPAPAPWLGGDGRLRWAAEDPVAAMLALVARDALELVTSPAIERVRACAGEGCAALFLDGSRPGTRRWCSMDTCGNRAKKQTLRSKATGAS